MAVTAYASATFKSPDPGPMAVARFVGVIFIIWAIAWAIHRKRASYLGGEQAGKTTAFASALGALALIGAGAYGPHALFRVTPWPMGVVTAGPEGATSHSGPVIRVKAWKQTEFERTVAADTYKWCGFCHSFNKGGEHKAGPNLYAMFDQKAASAPNFYYSPAMAGRRDAGLIWTDETLDLYLANSDSFIPGTSMVISSGPVTDPKVRRAVINMLKRDTMAGAIDEVPAPSEQ